MYRLQHAFAVPAGNSQAQVSQGNFLDNITPVFLLYLLPMSRRNFDKSFDVSFEYFETHLSHQIYGNLKTLPSEHSCKV
jgi:hypothetical protein